MASLGVDQTRASDLRADVWDKLWRRAREFRSYERLKLLAMRVAVEEKRVNSARNAVPQPKLSEQMVWAKLPGTANQYGPVAKSKLAAAEGKGAGIGSMAASLAAPSKSFATYAPSPRASAAPSVRASAAPSVRGSAAPSARASAAGAPPAAMAAATPGTSGDYDYSNLSNTYDAEEEATFYQQPAAAAPPAAQRQASGRTASVPASVLASSRPASVRGSAAPSARASRAGTPPLTAQPSESGSVAASRELSRELTPQASQPQGRGGKRYETTDSVPDFEEEPVPDEEDEF
ncbi:hypothetical protein GPECTOR_25g434 [Gonium pectorale]|uniref:Uncharacterized protein n=1 Tax=Gonium pectorale TaxID=33097 RepID=A0A150GG80_GONPE|nr:hypothetical protein GPECTOR_25g434 [Gonium pectorale]|eukprot:KXZ48849.1 hypothetical protein GPECTOR_25g434 [Gonium pectorale]